MALVAPNIIRDSTGRYIILGQGGGGGTRIYRSGTSSAGSSAPAATEPKQADIHNMTWQDSLKEVRSHVVGSYHGMDWVGDNAIIYTNPQGERYMIVFRSKKQLEYFYSLIYGSYGHESSEFDAYVFNTFQKAYPGVVKKLKDVTLEEFKEAGVYVDGTKNGFENAYISDKVLYLPDTGRSIKVDHINHAKKVNVKTEFNYGYTDGRIYNPASKSSIIYGGNYVNQDGISNYVYHSGGAIYRDISASSYGDIKYSEYLSVYSGYGKSFGEKVVSGKGYITAKDATPHREGNKVYKQLDKWDIDTSSFNLDIDYNTYLRQAGDSFGRGIFKVHLVKYDGAEWKIVDTLVDANGNAGCITYNYDNLCNPKSISKKYNSMLPGEYGIVLEFEDTFEDSDRDYNGIHFYGAINYNLTQLGAIGEYTKDDTMVVVHIRDLSTGAIIGEYVYSDVVDQLISFTVPKDSTYRVIYTLYKGHGTEGGLYGKGGGFLLYGGVFDEGLLEIPIDDIPEDYRGSLFDLNDIRNFVKEPYPETFKSYDKVVTGRWLWLDAIKIERHKKDDYLDESLMDGTCYPEGIGLYVDNVSAKDVSVTDSREIEDYIYNMYDGEVFNSGRIELDLHNKFDTPIEVTFSLITQNACEGFPVFEFFNGFFWFDGYDYDKVMDYNDSLFKVQNLQLYEYEPIMGGGCNGSKFHICIEDSEGSVVASETFVDGGEYEFDFGNLLSYGDTLKVRLFTEQHGRIINDVDLRSLFKLNKFIVEGCYELKASDFSSNLKFYINDELTDVFDGEHSGEVIYSVKKGLNKYKWVFTNQNNDFTWDYAKINWLRLTNWVCDNVTVTPYCEVGNGDKCIEALIGSLLDVLPKPKHLGCVFLRHVDKDTGKVLKYEYIDDLAEGEHTFQALELPYHSVVGDSEKTVYIIENGMCIVVEFKYVRTVVKDPILDCVEIIHIDRSNNQVLETEFHYNLFPGEYTFYAKEFKNYRLVGEESYTLEIKMLEEESDTCQVLIFEYEPIVDGCAVGKKIWLFT